MVSVTDSTESQSACRTISNAIKFSILGIAALAHGVVRTAKIAIWINAGHTNPIIGSHLNDIAVVAIINIVSAVHAATESASSTGCTTNSVVIGALGACRIRRCAEHAMSISARVADQLSIVIAGCAAGTNAAVPTGLATVRQVADVLCAVDTSHGKACDREDEDEGYFHILI